MERSICIHGHFYQPPRENPWLEAVQLQDSAFPAHDWNERITHECYAPNAASRILNEEGHIVRIVNNYSLISFNFGPSLLRWMQERASDVYQAILEADCQSRPRFDGHGSALAQAYHHSILPLCNERDKRTEVRWGILDFEHRFGRRPEGMWLPETAVDLQTLEILSEQGIAFTILGPYQARRVRKIQEKKWEDASQGRIDTSRPYRIELPSGRSMNLFFYDGPLSRAVAFERLLSRGEHFASRLVGAFSAQNPAHQLVHIATDGETFGHHHRHGEMGLTYALHYIEQNKLATLSNYGRFLETHPPQEVVEIIENSSWSCVHGVERWRSDCGCRTGGKADWKQNWREPLRLALNWLRDRLASLFESQSKPLLQDGWAARDDYIEVVLDRTPETLSEFFRKHSRSPQGLSRNEQIQALKLLELQRQSLQMYTSCGWFFSELSGIETVQVLQYAGRALHLAEELCPKKLEPDFLTKLAAVPSNVPEWGNGRKIYEKLVRPNRVELSDVVAHYAINSLFEPYDEETGIYCYSVERNHYEVQEAGKARLLLGRAQAASRITGEYGCFSFGVLHFGDHNLVGGVRHFQSEVAFEALRQKASEVFARADFAETLRVLDHHFGAHSYSLKSLFQDERRAVLNSILGSTLGELEREYQQIYERNAPLMRFLADLGIPQPRALQLAAELVLNSSLKRHFESEVPDFSRIEYLLEEAENGVIPLDKEVLSLSFTRSFERVLGAFLHQPDDLSLLEQCSRMATLAQALPFSVNLWTAQNSFYEIKEKFYSGMRNREDDFSRRWIKVFRELGINIFVQVE